jgi:Protein of unknown function (Hypoth_ymh)
MDEAWAIGQLKAFIAKCEEHTDAYDRGGEMAHRNQLISALHQDALSLMPIIEKIADRAWPAWRDHKRENVSFGWEYDSLVGIARQLIVMLERSAELAEKLGDSAPKLSASHLHAWVWDSAKKLWNSGHYRDAVAAAARGVNAMTQAKVSRKDVSEVDLFKQCFSPNAPVPNQPRLRLWPDDGSRTYQSVHKGAMAYADGLYSAIRNPASHAVLPELTEDEGLEQLAAFSVLARCVDTAKLDT